MKLSGFPQAEASELKRRIADVRRGNEESPDLVWD